MKPVTNSIFVFGSNEAGIHGAGSALAAYKQHGAVWGKGSGFYGHSYAIPTKDRSLRPLSTGTIRRYVEKFIEFARLNPGMRFHVVKIGCGLAGFSEQEIAPMFKGAPANCELPHGWRYPEE